MISLAQQGLPATLVAKATLDATTLNLPLVRRQVSYGTSHSYSFPGYVADATGVLYVTLQAGFAGPVTRDLDATAVYRTMTQILDAGVSNGQVGSRYAGVLRTDWAAVEKQMKTGKASATRSKLHSFANAVRAQAGKKVARVLADDLIAVAQVVYAALGGTGRV